MLLNSTIRWPRVCVVRSSCETAIAASCGRHGTMAAAECYLVRFCPLQGRKRFLQNQVSEVVQKTIAAPQQQHKAPQSPTLRANGSSGTTGAVDNASGAVPMDVDGQPPFAAAARQINGSDRPGTSAQHSGRANEALAGTIGSTACFGPCGLLHLECFEIQLTDTFEPVYFIGTAMFAA